MQRNLPGPIVKTLAAAALMALVAALSFGCGKSEKERETAAKSAAKSGAKSANELSIALPADFPRDVPILENATLKAAVSNGDRILVQLHTVSSIKQTIDFYNVALKSEGWTVESAPPATGDMFVISAKKGRTLCGVTIAKDGKGTLIQLAISPARS